MCCFCPSDITSRWWSCHLRRWTSYRNTKAPSGSCTRAVADAASCSRGITAASIFSSRCCDLPFSLFSLTTDTMSMCELCKTVLNVELSSHFLSVISSPLTDDQGFTHAAIKSKIYFISISVRGSCLYGRPCKAPGSVQQHHVN